MVRIVRWQIIASSPLQLIKVRSMARMSSAVAQHAGCGQHDSRPCIAHNRFQSGRWFVGARHVCWNRDEPGIETPKVARDEFQTRRIYQQRTVAHRRASEQFRANGPRLPIEGAVRNNQFLVFAVHKESICHPGRIGLGPVSQSVNEIGGRISDWFNRLNGIHIVRESDHDQPPAWPGCDREEEDTIEVKIRPWG